MSRGSTPKSCKPAGSGRAGLKRRLSSSLKPGGVAGHLHSCRSGIRKLARRAGGAGSCAAAAILGAAGAPPPAACAARRPLRMLPRPSCPQA